MLLKCSAHPVNVTGINIIFVTPVWQVIRQYVCYVRWLTGGWVSPDLAAVDCFSGLCLCF